MEAFEEQHRSSRNVLATALKRLYPETISDVYPLTTSGFYYDIKSPRHF